MQSKSLGERGQALVIIALAAIGLVGMVGLAIDGGAKFSDRRHAQNAADASALAAALIKTNKLAANETPHPCSTVSGFYNDPSFCLPIIYAAWDRAEQNGYDGATPDRVDVYSPPISGPYINDGSYVQVVITSYVDTYLARILGINQTKNTVEAVAYLHEGGPLFGGASLISVDPSPSCGGGNGSGGGSVDVGGNGSVNLDGGGIFINSDETCGYSQTSCGLDLNITNGGGILSAGSNIYMKDRDTGNTCNTDPNPPLDNTQQQYAVPDDIYMPDEPAECGWTATTYPTYGDPMGNDWTITPGLYTDFPQQNINGGKGGKWVRIIMEPGIYCVDGDVDWHGSIFQSLDGTSGVTIYIKSGHTFNFRIDSDIRLNASGPSADEYENFLIIVDGSHESITNCQINGGDYLSMNGMIYAPYCNVTINGNSTSVSEFNAQVLGWDLKVNGNNTINFTYDPDYVPVIKRRVGLMR